MGEGSSMDLDLDIWHAPRGKNCPAEMQYLPYPTGTLVYTIAESLAFVSNAIQYASCCMCDQATFLQTLREEIIS